MNITEIFSNLVFLCFAITFAGAALMTVAVQNPVRSALFLVLSFFGAAGLWILMTAEFLGLVLVLVYVGAVMTLFLFVVMTLNIEMEKLRVNFFRYLPYGIVIVVMLVMLMIYAVRPDHFNQDPMLGLQQQPVDYSNIKELGAVLYTNFAYPFELAGILLLVAIIAAISLTFRGKQNNKNPDVEKQLYVDPAKRIRIVKMQSEKK
jgi:NADH-quinone oxidoreductase subunit J